MNLIVNADDFGLTKGVNLGILEGIRQGIVTSCTMIANGAEEAFIHGAQLYHEHKLDVGVHLVLTMGKPLSENVSTLTDENGTFFKLDEIEANCLEMNPAEIKKEFIAQVNKIKQTGIEITHLDSHHHVHMLPVISAVYLELAKELRLPVRGFLNEREGELPDGVRCPRHLNTGFYGSEMTAAAMVEILGGLSGENAEIMCHPGYADQKLIDMSRYNIMREKELDILCSNEVKETIRQRNIRLIGYRNI